MKPAKLIVLVLLAIAAGVAIALSVNGSLRTASTDEARPGDQRVPADAAMGATIELSKSGLDGDQPLAGGESSSGPSLEAVAGHWGSAGGECHSGESFVLDASGEYSDEGSVGNWKLAGTKLTVTTTDVEHAGLGPSETGSTPRTTVVTLMDVTPQSLTWADDEGRKNKFSRCP